ncbi:MAG: hypothetical protein ABIV47_17030 [Roseiflexaceae bacterium]
MISTSLFRLLPRLVVVCTLLLLLAAPARAQGRFRCDDNADRLDCARIEAAAKPLLDRGAAVAVYMVRRGDSSGADFRARLRNDGLMAGEIVNASLVAIYVSIDPRYAELRGGDSWNAALLPGDNISTIRTSKLVPALAAGTFTDGYIDTLAAIEASIASPPQPSANPPALPQVATGAAGGDSTPLAVGALVIVALAGGGYATLRWRKARQTLAEARWYCTQAKQEAGAAIVELGSALQVDRDKADYDQLSYAAADVKQLADTQRATTEQFAQIQTRFDDTGERLARLARPPVADYTTASTGYQQVRMDADALCEQLMANERLRQTLDALAQQAPAELAQARSRLDEAVRRLDLLAGVIADRDAVLAPLHQQIGQAEAALAAHDARQAIEIAQGTAAGVVALGASLQNYTELRGRIAQGRAEAAVLVQQGYHATASQAALDQAQAALDAAAAALQRGGAAAAAAPLGDVLPALEQAMAHGRGLLALRAENDSRLLVLGVHAREVAALLDVARQAFDSVDEFAESTWSDIRGNGSEAEASVAEAARLWQRAVDGNTIASQEFSVAHENLNAVEVQLARAASLSDAILARLKALEHARAIAKNELAAAVADIATGQAYLSAHDPDVGKQPEQQLRQATELLAQAEAESIQAKPDWLALVRLAQAANSAADAALAGARSEVEAIDKARSQAQHARQLAAAEVQRAERFCESHRSDVGWDAQGSLRQLQAQLQAAYAALSDAESRAEDERSAALERARSQFASVDAEADRVYSRLYADFQRAEAAREAAQEEERRRRSHSSSSSTSFSSSSSSFSSSSSSHSSSSSSGSSSGGSWGSGSSSGGGW